MLRLATANLLLQKGSGRGEQLPPTAASDGNQCYVLTAAACGLTVDYAVALTGTLTIDSELDADRPRVQVTGLGIRHMRKDMLN